MKNSQSEFIDRCIEKIQKQFQKKTGRDISKSQVLSLCLKAYLTKIKSNSSPKPK